MEYARAVRCLVITLALLGSVGACKKSEPAHHEDRNTPQEAPTQLHLDVTIAGAKAMWGADAFAKTPKATATNHGGEARDQWSLHELVKANVGPTARVVSVTGAAGTKSIDETAWNDPDRTPILHSTRRGTLKFRWADKAGTWGDAVTNDVTALEIVK